MGYWDVGIVYSLTEATFRTFSLVWIAFPLGSRCVFSRIHRKCEFQ